MKNQRGQTLIVVILILLVVSLVVLAVASRSLTDIKISQTSEESTRAFSAAEAGVEEAVERIRGGNIAIGAENTISLPTQANAGTYSIETQGVSTQAFLASAQMPPDTGAFQVYLTYGGTSYTNATNELCLLWGNEGIDANASDAPSLEAMVVYRSGATYTSARYAIDPQGRNSFTTAANNCNRSIAVSGNNLGVARNFAFSHKISLPSVAPSDRVLLRIRLLRNVLTSHYVGVAPEGGANLPSQGYTISSTGVSGQSTRKVEVFEAFPTLPALFDFVFYNYSGTVSK